MNRRLQEYRLVMLGDRGVGKRALANQFFPNSNYNYGNAYSKRIVVDEEPGILTLYQARPELGPARLHCTDSRGCQGFVLVYSIASRSSFEKLKEFYRQIHTMKHTGPANLIATPIVLVGNNSHKVAEREVSTQEGWSLARDLGCEFIEASAKTGSNVDNVFLSSIRLLSHHQSVR